MTRGKAEDAGGLTPAKDDNAAPYHFDRRTLPIFKCVDYIAMKRIFCAGQKASGARGVTPCTAFLPYVAVYSATMASVGQLAAQAPQSTQASASITYWVSPWEIASTGQFSAQVPQLTQASVIL